MWVEHTVQHVVIICQKINNCHLFCLSITIVEGFGGEFLHLFLYSILLGRTVTKGKTPVPVCSPKLSAVGWG